MTTDNVGAVQMWFNRTGRQNREGPMPILRLVPGAAFDPSVIKAMTTAFDAALRDLNITDRTDPKAEMVARKIIECAQKGERNPDRMREIAVTAFAG